MMVQDVHIDEDEAVAKVHEVSNKLLEQFWKLTEKKEKARINAAIVIINHAKQQEIQVHVRLMLICNLKWFAC